jgi:hypothetical protein
MFARNSRYRNVETTTYTAPDGRVVAYLRRRFVPHPPADEPLARHTLSEGERLDIIAARFYDDPELFWQICDANRAMHPRELSELVGRRIVIPLPQ